MLMGSAIAYDWTYSSLSAAERQTIRAMIARWAQRMYEASALPYQDAWTNWWAASYFQNHYWTNNSALGMAGLALIPDGQPSKSTSPSTPQVWVDQAYGQLSKVRDILDSIQDGSWHESIDYQSYGLTMMLPFLINIRKIEHRDILPHKYLQNYSLWRIYNSLPNSDQFIMAYGDFEWWWGNSYESQNILRFIAHEYRDGRAEWMAQQILSVDKRSVGLWAAPWDVMEFLYYDPTIQPQPPTDLPLARTFPDLEGVIWRSGWGNDDLVFGLKTGAYGGRFGFNTFPQDTYPWSQPCRAAGCTFNTRPDHSDANTLYLYN